MLNISSDQLLHSYACVVTTTETLHQYFQQIKHHVIAILLADHEHEATSQHVLVW